MRFSETLGNIAKALAEAQAEIKNPIKNQTNKGVQGAPMYANLEDTLQEYVRPILSKHQLAFFQSIKSDEQSRVGVCTLLVHESGEFIESDYCYCDVKIPVSKEGKEILTQGQATGVAITYLRRYSLNAALGINGDKDTDGSVAEVPQAPRQQPRPAQQAQASQQSSNGGGASYVIGFGKYNGKTVGDVALEDRRYLEWLVGQDKTRQDLKDAISQVLGGGEELQQVDMSELPF